MASPKTRKLYDGGVPLDEAWTGYADPELASEFNAAPNFLNSLSEHAHQNFGAGLSALPDILSKAGSAMTHRSKLESELKSELLSELFNGQLIAVGYPEYPLSGKTPVIIEANHFDDFADVHWKSERVSAHGRVWGRVHVSLPPQTNAQPSSAALIRNAISELAKENAAFRSLGRKGQRQLVIEKLGRDYASGNGLSEQNVDKHLLQLLGPKRLI